LGSGDEQVPVIHVELHDTFSKIVTFVHTLQMLKTLHDHVPIVRQVLALVFFGSRQGPEFFECLAVIRVVEQFIGCAPFLIEFRLLAHGNVLREAYACERDENGVSDVANFR
jgi:hypothetical protein